VTDGETNATLPKGTDPTALTEEVAMDLLAVRRAAGPPVKRGAKRAVAKKVAPKATAKAPAAEKKAAPKKAAAKKAAPKKTATKKAPKKAE
jgi:DNA topoisomerase-1